MARSTTVVRLPVKKRVAGSNPAEPAGKKQTFAQLKKKLWKLFSEYVRRRDKGICFTCGARNEWKYTDAGHFIPASVGGLALYFHEDNVHCQCKRCNMPPLCGNQYVYGVKLGEETVARLRTLQGQITKDFPFEEKIDFYSRKIKDSEFV